MEVGLDLVDPTWGGGRRPLLNSAAADRQDVLDLAASRGCPVVLSSTGETMPSGTEERMVRAIEMIEMAQGHGLPLSSLHVDPLVIPIGVDAEAGAAYLEAVRQLRERYGPELHITGGVSNVSFGMPARRLISDVFLDLCVQAGQDSGIVDPVAADIARALSPDRDAEGLSAGGGPADRHRRVRGRVHRGVPGRAPGRGRRRRAVDVRRRWLAARLARRPWPRGLRPRDAGRG